MCIRPTRNRPCSSCAGGRRDTGSGRARGQRVPGRRSAAAAAAVAVEAWRMERRSWWVSSRWVCRWGPRAQSGLAGDCGGGEMSVDGWMSGARCDGAYISDVAWATPGCPLSAIRGDGV